MSTFLVGTVALAATIAFGAMDGSASSLLNLHGLVIVVGGTIAVFVATTPLSLLRAILADALAVALRGGERHDAQKVIAALASNGTRARAGLHPLVDYARSLWEQGVAPALVEDLLVRRASERRSEGQKVLGTLKNLAKYPPALGMTGTVVGLVNLFSHLGTSGKESLGPSLALAMTATFYGLVLANAIVLPLADRLEVLDEERAATDEAILQALVLLGRDEPLDLLRGGATHEAA